MSLTKEQGGPGDEMGGGGGANMTATCNGLAKTVGVSPTLIQKRAGR